MTHPTRRAVLAGSLGASAFAPLLVAADAARADITLPPVESGSFFVKIPTIPGESRDRAHAGEIDVLDWSLGVTTAISPTNTGQGASKSKPSDLVFVHRYDKASPLLFLAAASGRHLGQAVLTVRRAGEAPIDYLTITLSNAFVTSVSDALNAADGSPVEQVHLSYGAIKISYAIQNPDGSVGSSVTAAFDFITNKTL